MGLLCKHRGFLEYDSTRIHSTKFCFLVDFTGRPTEAPTEFLILGVTPKQAPRTFFRHFCHQLPVGPPTLGQSHLLVLIKQHVRPSLNSCSPQPFTLQHTSELLHLKTSVHCLAHFCPPVVHRGKNTLRNASFHSCSQMGTSYFICKMIINTYEHRQELFFTTPHFLF